MTTNLSRIGIAGAGAWGRALAGAAERAGAKPLIWSRRPAVIADQAPGIVVTANAADLAEIDALLFAVAAQDLESVARQLAPHLAPQLPLVICAKGIARPANVLLDEVLAASLPGRPIAVLSGPNFAAEVMRGMPTAVTIASHDLALARNLVEALGSASFRPYVSNDPTGVQIGGAIKNVIAIACGIVAGRGLGENARAALMTRGLAEIARLGRALGAEPETLAGMAGLGDLVLSATSPTSRNFRLGAALGRGTPLQHALAEIPGVVEGVETAPAVVALAARYGVEMPISEAVSAIVAGRGDIDAAIGDLLARPFKSETA